MFIFVAPSIFGQHPIGDKLEQLYSQGHYGIVYRKSKRFMLNSKYENLIAPKYYRAISGLQRLNNLYWYSRNSDVIKYSMNELIKLKKNQVSYDFLLAHSYELFELKNDLNNWLTELSQTKYKQNIHEYSNLFRDFFEKFDFQSYENHDSYVKSDLNGVSQIRQDLVQFSKNYLGIPYQWGGTSPEGFDCSGFTQFLMKHKGVQIPRTAGDQYIKCSKIDSLNAQCGDLIFFKNENKISHVGMVISKKGESIKMIHASSSKGISIIEVAKSSYWKKRYYALGTFLE
ncbi:MAG: hypothetical protein RLZ10_2812 [Bacteroidota bacterium]|jgi:hypothetical protein